MLKNSNPTQTNAWKALQKHFTEVKDHHTLSLFEKDPARGEKFTIKWHDFYVDYSKNRIDEETMKLLVQLADECHLKDAIEKYFGGDLINNTEKRAVLHTALRAPENSVINVDGKNVMPEVVAVKHKIKQFSEEVISGKRKGYTGKAFTDVVNIGIGGSDLGPAMVTEALKFYKNHLNVHFISNVDGDHVLETIKHLNPETTLIVIVSKTFTTLETLSNALTVKEWFLKSGSEKDIAKHFVAVSTNLQEIDKFGIDPDNVFPMWDWVGGRFSLWSAVGLSIALSVGYDNFDKLLKGAHAMDEHFRTAPFEKNIPVVLALLSVWYNNFYGSESQAIIPYTQYLQRLAAYLQQGIMESNGKQTDRDGNAIPYQTGVIIWGEPGTNSQHAFFQLIHQGTKLIPTDFIGFKHSLHGNTDHHNKLMANFFAQTEALLKGKTEAEVRKEMGDKVNEALVPFKVFTGNRPTTSILIDKLTPESLGSLIAMYEHKIFVEGVIWNIYSYDQWGVELGKQLASKILKDLATSELSAHDSSTTNLLKQFKK
ncbi:glucose-6-phosphate isomerase [Capnocytophaga periodontitidis]|uniref:glucose-6-phosphate isomerase n=1 Tax=Capnocytophaga periodontitidis TaxID=2795027 RepID=UPI0018E1B6C2|nr:glucose-6-phosphate isomerase [Capnocytophaga periodontitidis]MBI1669115.1 glucose-6-phosphate isomerase [Capnocytophaga periodontitidis]